MSSSPPQRLLLISVPRTASNLLLKVLNIPQQPQLTTNEKSGYFFYDAFTRAAGAGLHKPLSEWPAQLQQDVHDAFQAGVDSLEAYSEHAQADHKAMFAKEHAFWMVNPACYEAHEDKQYLSSFRVQLPLETYGTQTFSSQNPTVLPDEYLRSWRMAFVIRHPALAWPSMYRAMQKIATLGVIDQDGVQGASAPNMTLRWTRRLYDWCVQEGQDEAPLVLDASDLIHHPAAVVRFCERAGLDSRVMQFEWDGSLQKSSSWSSPSASPQPQQEEEQRDPGMHQRAAAIMLSTLEGSSGVIRDKTPQTVDIPAEAKKWREEFGEADGTMIEQAVWASMDDYEYLRARRTT